MDEKFQFVDVAAEKIVANSVAGYKNQPKMFKKNQDFPFLEYGSPETVRTSKIRTMMTCSLKITHKKRKDQGK